MSFEKLYDINFPLSADKMELYFQGDFEIADQKIILKKAEILDLGTYFNSLSVAKWSQYTTLKKFKVSLQLKGSFFVDFYGVSIYGEDEILRIKCKDSFDKDFYLADFSDFDLLGIRLTALNDNAEFLGGEYSGEFITENEVKIGIIICTFKREKYLLPNLEKLKTLTTNNKNISVMVIDNGSTLDETQSDELQILHNPNFGGSGGFTRGLIEQVTEGKNSHVILMDDDVVIELSSFERLYTVLRHMKLEYQSNFFAGAMLNIDMPTIQSENTAYWNKVISKTFGNGFDLTNKQILCLNEHTPEHVNSYAGWWFCCIPIEVIKKIGYPLPNFIKGDDIEYGIRNGSAILSMNGIGVWHEAFAKKLTPIMKFFSDRSMLLVNHFAEDCNKFTFTAAVLLRILKRFFKFDFDSIRILEFALRDLNGGFEQITSTRADKKFESLKNTPLDKNIISTVISIINLTIQHCDSYDKLDKSYKNFRDYKLMNQQFWRRYLMIN